MCRAPERRPTGAPAGSGLPPLTALVAAPAPRRARLWDLPASLHCPIIGTCLDIDGLRRIARRFGFDHSPAASPGKQDFALHSEAVGRCQTRNPVSELIQRQLERHYRLSIERFSRLRDEAALREAWAESCNRGDVAGPLWAALTHRFATTATRERIYQDIHMLSHQVGARQAADTRRLAHLERENTELKAGLRRELAALRSQLAAAEAGLAERDTTRAHVAELEKRLAHFESGQAMVEMGRRLLSLQTAHQALHQAQQRIWQLDHTLRDAQLEITRIADERDTALAERNALELLIEASLPAAAEPCSRAGSDDCAGCSEALGPRCILYVGGRAALIAQYRQLAGRLGISLIHHDGGLEESLTRLPDMIGSADAVVCPTDRVSHSAYHHVKSHCKRAGKPCLFYQGGGVSGFAVAMSRVQRGEFSLAGSAAADD